MRRLHRFGATSKGRQVANGDLERQSIAVAHEPGAAEGTFVRGRTRTRPLAGARVARLLRGDAHTAELGTALP